MPHPELDNATRLECAPVFVADEDGRPILAMIVKATLVVPMRGELTLAEKQVPVDFAGKPYGEPGKSSYRIEPEVAFVKPATDVVLLGHAHAPQRGATEVAVGLRLGPVTKVARVTGDRVFEEGVFGKRIGKPQPFEKIPLQWERAFGGWDRSAEKPEHHDCEPANQVGVGFAAKRGVFVAGAPVPNIEDADKPLKGWGGRSPPAGFGFVNPEWQPRARFAGTFDATWEKTRSPLLPKDFNRRFFNAAPEGLVAPGYLRGDEVAVALGVTPEGRWEFQLPGLAAPRCQIAVRTGAPIELTTNLDTIILDADARTATLLWRAFTPLRTGPHDVRAIRVTSEDRRVARHAAGAPAASPTVKT